MSKIKLMDFFRDEYLQTISSYIKLIKQVLNTYDMVIFMARKAICFYHSLCINEVISPTDCQVISSRVLDYNTIKSLSDKRIAVVDDVVVKGRSIMRVHDILCSENIDADYYVAAAEHVFITDFQKKNALIKNTFAHYSQSEIYQLSGLITQYISASMYPFDIDSATYSINTDNTDIISYILLEGNNSIDITNGLQLKYGIKSAILFYKFNFFKNECLDNFFSDIIFKVRILKNEDELLALPSALLCPFTYEQINEIYSYLFNEEKLKFTHSENPRICAENKLKVIRYALSDLLFEIFIKQFNLCSKRITFNDKVQFDLNFADEFCLNETAKAYLLKGKLNPIDISSQKFLTHFYAGKLYEFILKGDISEIYEDAFGNPIANNYSDDNFSNFVLTYEKLNDFFKYEKTIENPLEYSAAIIDAFVDKGLFVPSIVHYDNQLVYAYRMGEYSKLTKDNIHAFINMLFSYQYNVERDLDKIEFEKLCVIFFRNAVKQKLFDEQVEYDDDCYSIGYSLYGPRVSTGRTAYKVSQDSALITDFGYKGIVSTYKNKYRIKNAETINDLSLQTYLSCFAYDFSLLQKLFEKFPYKKDNNPWNQYVHTYNQFLTLAAIGDSLKNQILSLCAELSLFINMNDNFFDSNISDVERCEDNYCLSGINSGLWKYWCYKNDALKKTCKQIQDKDIQSARALINIIGKNDKNPQLEKIRDICGLLLYKIAFLVNEIVFCTNNQSKFEIKENDDSGNSLTDSRTIFNLAPYFGLFREERHKIHSELNSLSIDNIDLWIKDELNYYKEMAQQILDWCDLYLDQLNPNYAILNKVLVIYSAENDLPNELMKYCNISFPSLNDSRKILVVPVDSKPEFTDLRNGILDLTYNLYSIKYIEIYLNSKHKGFVQINSHAKGTNAKKLIKEIIKHINSIPVSNYKEYFIIDEGGMENRKDTDISKMMLGFRSGYKLLLLEDSHILDNYKITRFKITINQEDINMSKSEKTTNNYFNAPITANGVSVFGGDISGEVVTNNNCFSQEDLIKANDIILKAKEEIEKCKHDSSEEIIIKLDEIKDEIAKNRPDKNKIKTVLDWVQKTTSIAGFALSLKNVLGI